MPQATETKTASKNVQVLVGLASCGVAAGAAQVNEALIEALKPYDVSVKGTGCIGMCHAEPLVEIIDAEGRHYMYGKVTPDRAKKIAESHVLDGRPID